MSEQEYNFAGDMVTPEGKDFKNPSLGQHPVRISNIQFLPTYVAEYQGKKKDPAPMVAIEFKLFDMDEEGNCTPNEDQPTMVKVFPFKWHKLAQFTKFMCKVYPDKLTLDTRPDDALFNKCIAALLNSKRSGLTAEVVADGKAKADDGSPKYVTLDSFSVPMAIIAKAIPEVEGGRILPFSQITEDGIRMLKGYDVRKYIIESDQYEGSKAQAIIEEIRKEDPDFAKQKKKEDEADGRKDEAKKAASDEPAAATDSAQADESLDENEDF